MSTEAGITFDQPDTTTASPTYLRRRRRFCCLLVETLIWLSLYVIAGFASFGILLMPLLIANVGYQAFFYWYFGGNIGHLALRARVVNHRNGEPLNFGQALGRALLNTLDNLLLPFIINCGMVLIRSDRRHLYDLMAGTVVIYDQRAAGDQWTRIAPQ